MGQESLSKKYALLVLGKKEYEKIKLFLLIFLQELMMEW
jgi:hypothetical protein